MKFEQLHLITPLLRAVEQEGYETPSPIQEKAIPGALEGRDILGCAQTGTGKTAAFALPILQRLAPHAKEQGRRPIRALVLTPTRELALQIYENFCGYGRHLRLRSAVIFGGVSQVPQVEALRRGVDILVATPGRLWDLMNQGHIRLDAVEIFVLDEADRMLDMGFVNDVKKIVAKLPQKKQTLFFSATMPREIQELVSSLLTNPIRVEVTPQATTVELIDQSVYFVDKANKRRLLTHLLRDDKVTSALVFTRTKHGADRVVRELGRDKINAQAIHGNKSQNARQQALQNFKSGKIRVLVATDIAARGIDVEELSHVFNYDLPNIPETYVHRIGRTGRAGLSGTAISFCDYEEKAYLSDIEKLIGKPVPVVEDHPYPMQVFEVAPNQERGQRRPSHQQGRQQPDGKGKSAQEGRRPAQRPAAPRQNNPVKAARPSQQSVKEPASQAPHQNKRQNDAAHAPKAANAQRNRSSQDRGRGGRNGGSRSIRLPKNFAEGVITRPNPWGDIFSK
ncbi:DEAD/DEAH box helicase [Zongyangia hominis]|uniref:ATP-dependent RNA helicase CshA n=1 Tax=Zongyangia hominis TaxID=2763677 RepID=A0A926ECK9_9FIRM|nr:DEAD/DEAH box helicase [Zongyangia hominis]MBC8569754.1 DEAD/DEAH box helicase [Zongyangia hominis]